MFGSGSGTLRGRLLGRFSPPFEARGVELATLLDQSPPSLTKGRPRSIPAWVWPEVFRLREQGLGYRRVAAGLVSLKVWTTKSSVERLVKGKPPYTGGRPSL